ncbi:ABC transporter ATP-binding protein [[Eubacterium] cellulosolvens]
MAKVTFKDVNKHYGSFTAVKDLDLEVDDQEFLVLVGPSGCGKTTTLRMLAGLEEVSEGTISIGDQVVNEVPPKERDIAMVFQSYALYPHYSIYENLAFGLRTREASSIEGTLISLVMAAVYISVAVIWFLISFVANLILPGMGDLLFVAGIFGGIITLVLFSEVRSDIRKMVVGITSDFSQAVKDYMVREQEIERKVQETSDLLGIQEQLWKKPKQLSGGQRQRVALGRAIIRNPQVFLMDEPLSNLDAKLRVQMRAELQRLQKRLRVTSIYVTHDQIEAMTLADRIAIMNEGLLQQVGTPDEVYTYPSNKFVAGFIGSPSMNFIQGTIKDVQGTLSFVSEVFSYNIPKHYISSLEPYRGKTVWFGIRPEHISLNPSSNGNLIATVGVLEPIGSDTFIYIDFHAETTLIVKIEGYATFTLGQQVEITFKDDSIHFFDTETEERIKPK